MNKTTLYMLGMFANLLTGISVPGCKQSSTNIEIADSSGTELYRPQFHFTPEANWMNDPNGMVYYKGEYHLFYQYYPDSNVWGPMHWGHAVSPDMVRWEHLPVALYPDSLGYIFSGSAVADVRNTSGLGTEENPPLVAVFTYHDPLGEKNGSHTFQNQAIAYSIDSGRNWNKYSGNPVLKSPGISNFRDPKVFWHTESGKWTMILAVNDCVHLYSSPNLVDWTFLSEFGKGIGAHGGVWECPDLFRINVNGTSDMKWVMLVSINPGGPNGGSATQYFVGNFDGMRFTVEKWEIQWVDWGRDNYAGVTWSNVPESDGRRLFLGWMGNWQYATVVPTYGWRSAMTLPRELSLIRKDNGYELISNPVRELKSLRTGKALVYEEIQGSQTVREVFTDSINLSQCELIFNFELADNTMDSLGILLENSADERLIIGYSGIQKEIYIDRTAAGTSDFSDTFAGISKASYTAGKQMRFQIFLDASSVELFVDHGNRVLTNLVFPAGKFTRLKIFSSGGRAIAKRAEFYNLNHTR